MDRSHDRRGALPVEDRLGASTNNVGGTDEGERALLRRVAAEDREAFRQLYSKYHGRLVRFLSRVIRDPDDAEEVIQDTLMIVWQHAEDFRGTSRVSTWIFGIAYRRALNALRRSATRSRVLVPEGEGVEGSVEDVSKETEERQLVELGLSSLPPEQRLVMVLAYGVGLSCEEIAAIADCPVNTVKTRMYYARRKLREVISASAVPTRIGEAT
ncbi:MAG TPA: RNA polymerase sigma factor [Steroidobacteraceae bacterium]|nr:RNA polymerase sigma factor [Steroidobacteraceae bacterium]